MDTVNSKKRPSRLKSVAQWIWAATLIVSVVIFLSSALRIQRVRSSASWPATSGAINASDLQYRPLSRTALKYQLKFVYHYTVKGTQYEGNRISFAAKTSFVGRTSSERYVKQVLEIYPKGAEVTVYYDPSDPRLCVLDTHIPKRVFKSLLIGLGMALLSLSGLWRRWPMQTDYLFKPYDPDAPMTAKKFIFGALGLAFCIGIIWIWWELIKMYAGR